MAGTSGNGDGRATKSIIDRSARRNRIQQSTRRQATHVYTHFA